MIIIFEGPDGMGKTQLIANLLDSEINCQLVKTLRQAGIDNALPYHMQFDKMLATLPEQEIFLLDRHCSSDIAYSMLRGTITEQIIGEVRNRFIQLAKQHKIVYIQLMPTRQHKYMLDGYEEYDSNAYAQLVEAYKATFIQIGSLANGINMLPKFVTLNEPGEFGIAELRNLIAC